MTTLRFHRSEYWVGGCALDAYSVSTRIRCQAHPLPPTHARPSDRRMQSRALQQGECRLICSRSLVRIRDRRLQVAHQAVLQSVDPTVDDELLSAIPPVTHERGLAYIGNLLDDIELAQQIDASSSVTDSRHPDVVLGMHVLDVA